MDIHEHILQGLHDLQTIGYHSESLQIIIGMNVAINLEKSVRFQRTGGYHNPQLFCYGSGEILKNAKYCGVEIVKGYEPDTLVIQSKNIYSDNIYKHKFEF